MGGEIAAQMALDRAGKPLAVDDLRLLGARGGDRQFGLDRRRYRWFPGNRARPGGAPGFPVRGHCPASDGASAAPSPGCRSICAAVPRRRLRQEMPRPAREYPRSARAAAAVGSARHSAGRTDPRGTGPGGSAGCRSRWVAAMIRTSARIGVRPPTVVYSPSCSTRSSRVCASGGMSPISSRNSVPPSACSKRPAARWVAPVKAPRLVAEQLALDQLARDRRHVDRRRRARRAACRNRAARAPTSSLPVPDSPVIITVRSVPISRARVR